MFTKIPLGWPCCKDLYFHINISRNIFLGHFYADEPRVLLSGEDSRCLMSSIRLFVLGALIRLGIIEGSVHIKEPKYTTEELKYAVEELKYAVEEDNYILVIIMANVYC